MLSPFGKTQINVSQNKNEVKSYAAVCVLWMECLFEL